MKKLLLALFAILSASSTLANATDNAGDFGNTAGSNASFGTSGSNGGIAVGSGYANTYDAPTNGMIVEGAVGIGTTDPQTGLDVWDNANIHSGLQKAASYTIGAASNPLYEVLSTQEDVSQGGSNPIIGASGFGFVSGDNQASPVVWMYGDEGQNAFRVISKGYGSSIASDPVLFDVDVSGNVGIGTTNPAGKLDVEGGTAAASTNGSPINLVAQSAGTGNQNGGNIILMPGAATGTGTPGYVGIGTTSPANSLDVDTGGGIHIGSGTPTSTTNALYAVGSSLQWNGAAVAQASPYDQYADANTVLLLHMDNNANDSSIFGNTLTNTGVTFSNTVSKFGGYSAYFAGSATTNTHLDTASAPPINCTPNCTIDFWIQFSGNVPYEGSSTGYYENIIGSNTSFYSGFSIQVGSGATSGPPSVVHVNTGAYTPIIFNYAFSLHTWYHFAVEYINGSAAYLWINGIYEAGSTTNVVPITAQPVSIGFEFPGGGGYDFPVLGYIDELRMSSAVRYQPGVSFTPPTAPYNPGPIQ